MKYIIFVFASLLLRFGIFMPEGFLNTQYWNIHSAYAQSTVESIKSKIRIVVISADGKVTLATKNRLIELISNKIKASSNPVVTDIYIFFLREVKKLRTSDEVIPLSQIWSTQNQSPQDQSNAVNGSLPDFSISFASIPSAVSLDDKYAPVSIKIKNNAQAYSPDAMWSLKFGCRWVDGNIYPYRSYVDNQIIWSQSEISIEVANVFVGNLTSSKWFKLLTCKIDSSDLIDEENEDNNFVNVSVQIY